jgi:hypothetical protein
MAIFVVRLIFMHGMLFFFNLAHVTEWLRLGALLSIRFIKHYLYQDSCILDL